MTEEQYRKEIKRCDDEIAECEQNIHVAIGATIGRSDWMHERKLIMKEMAR
jgi:hypothetical protein